MRALERVRLLAITAGIPLCIATLGVAVEAAAFGRPAPPVSVAMNALRKLDAFTVMRGREVDAARHIGSICVEGKFPGDRHAVDGALVLLSDGTRLYDIGHGVRTYGGGPPTPQERRWFLLAGCPRLLDGRLGSRLVRGATTTRTRADGAAAYAVRVGKSSKLELLVARKTLRPLGVRLPGAGSSDLEPGSNGLAVAKVRRAFGLLPAERRRRV